MLVCEPQAELFGSSRIAPSKGRWHTVGLHWNANHIITGLIIPFPYALLRSIVPPSTLYRHIRNMVNRAREEVEECLQNDDLPRLHWVDNFAKYYASNSMFPNRELFKHCLWTAHGFKQLPLHFDLSWKNGADGESMAALPNIDELFTEVFLGNLTLDLNLLSCPFYDESFAVVRDVRRIPLKLVNTADPVEQAHLDHSGMVLGLLFL